jgi:hypothetical protein
LGFFRLASDSIGPSLKSRGWISTAERCGKRWGLSWGFVHDFPRDFNRDLDFQVVFVFLSDWPLFSDKNKDV